MHEKIPVVVSMDISGIMYSAETLEGCCGKSSWKYGLLNSKA
jgi:hypothetical protein